MQPPPFRIQPNDPQYLIDAAGEAAFFDKPTPFSTRLAIAFPTEAPFEAYNNSRLTGDPNARWFEVIQHHGPVRRALFYGVMDTEIEARILELNPQMHATFADISEGSLQRRRDEFGARFPGRIETLVADLNFAELPAQQYDAIISMSVLHHLQNIEWVAFQLNRALAPAGHLFLHDYVAENRFLLSDARRAIFEAIVARAKARGDIPQSWTVAWPQQDPWTYSPFEAIRCEDTLDVLAATLEPVAVRTTAALTWLLVLVSLSDEDQHRYETIAQHMFLRHPHSLLRRIAAAAGRRKRPAMSKRFQDELFLLDSLVIDSGLLAPLNAFGIYRKRA